MPSVIMVTSVTAIVAVASSISNLASLPPTISQKASEAPPSLGGLPACGPSRGRKGGWPQSDTLPAAAGLCDLVRVERLLPWPLSLLVLGPGWEKAHSYLPINRQLFITS